MTKTASISDFSADRENQTSARGATDWLAFQGPLRPLWVGGSDQLQACLAFCLPDWLGKVVPEAEQLPEPSSDVISVTHLSASQSPSGKPGFRIHCDLLPGGFFDCGDPLEGANALAGALTGSYIRQDPTLLQLHAASATFAQGAAAGQLLLLGDSLAGKSSLALQLARRGQRLFADDRLAVRLDCHPPLALSLGVGPKVRLPLHDDVEPAQRDFIEKHQVAEREAVAHLNLPGDLLAPLGELSPIIGLVLLDRQDTSSTPSAYGCSLAPLESATLLRHLLPKCLAPTLPAHDLVLAGRKLAQELPAWRLIYSSSSQAADHLIAHFES